LGAFTVIPKEPLLFTGAGIRLFPARTRRVQGHWAQRKKQKRADSSDRRLDGDDTAITGGEPGYYDLSEFWDCSLG
jgi:hypothetical protein